MRKLNRDGLVTANTHRYIAITIYNGTRTFLLTIVNLLAAVGIALVSHNLPRMHAKFASNIEADGVLLHSAREHSLANHQPLVCISHWLRY